MGVAIRGSGSGSIAEMSAVRHPDEYISIFHAAEHCQASGAWRLTAGRSRAIMILGLGRFAIIEAAETPGTRPDQANARTHA
jgi:hypothetical protein